MQSADMKTTINRQVFEAAMRAKGTNMNRVAAALGIAGPCVIQWRNGRNAPTLTNALRLSEMLGVDPRELFEVHP